MGNLVIERQKGGERAALIQVNIGKAHDPAVEEEFHLLAESAGAQALWCHHFNRGEPEPRYYIGKGQAEQIAEMVKAHEIELVIFNAKLSPSQERNLEKLLSARVLDRSGLVLDIFAQRARSHEGKLQVELAQLNHLATRLVRGWTHLERQKGGIGLRGPGETQLETDRRLLAARIKQLETRLEKVHKQREENRKARKRREFPTIALAGYTNSGKSTLFNALTDASVLAKDQLFATLDPTLRKLNTSQNPTLLLADTVGFISDLPHELVEAFKSTLEETIYADLIVHVIDSHDAERIEREAVVNQVLKEIGAEQVPVVKVYNKIDLTGESARLDYDEHGKLYRAHLSALTGEGVLAFQSALFSYFTGDYEYGWLKLAPDEGKIRAALFREQAILEEYLDEFGHYRLLIKLDKKRFYQLQSQYNRPISLQSEQPL
ncbi:MAG: GTPase HflX [Cardiobacteriaceae bacterium]|nr:GTPase HflX [Cardiobacteriaceae bacterium]